MRLFNFDDFTRREHYRRDSIDLGGLSRILASCQARVQRPFDPVTLLCATACLVFLTSHGTSQDKRRGIPVYPIFRHPNDHFRCILYVDFVLGISITAPERGTVLSDSQLLQSCADTGRIISLNAIVCVDALAKGLGGLAFGACRLPWSMADDALLILLILP